MPRLAKRVDSEGALANEVPPHDSMPVTGHTAGSGFRMGAHYLRMLRLLSHDARLYMVIRALTGSSLGIGGVLLNLYLLRLGYGPRLIGLVNGTGLLLLAVFSPVAGGIGRRWGTRLPMIVGVGLMTVATALIPACELIPVSWRTVWLMATRSLECIGGGLFFVNSAPFLMGATTPRERYYAFSLEGASKPLFAFASSLVAGLLVALFAATLGVSQTSPAPYRYPLLLASGLLIPSIAAMVATRGVEPGQGREPVAQAGPAPMGLITALSLIEVLLSAGLGVVRGFFNVYSDAALGLPASLIGVLMAVGQIAGIPSAMAVPLLMERLGQRQTIIVGHLGMAVSVLVLALVPHWLGAGLAFMGVTVMLAFTFTSTRVYTLEVVSPDWRSAMSGARSTANSVSYAVMALAGGYLVTAFGYRPLFLTGAGLTVAGTLFFWIYTVRRHRHPVDCAA